MYRRELAVLTVVATLVLWGGAATAVHAPTEQVATDGADSAAVASAAVQDEDAAVTFSDQVANETTVTVDNATLPEGGYVTIHDSSLLEGEVTGSVVGVSEYLEPGTHENVTITLYEDVPGADFSNATTPSGSETFVAMPHLETNDNQTYDFVATDGAADGPYVTDGEPVVDDANVTFVTEEAGTDRGVILAGLEAPDVTSPNTTVTVNATLLNTADEERTEDVAFRLEGGGIDVVVHQNVTVPASEIANVSFDVDTSGVPQDEYIHGVTTYNSSELTTITVTEDAQVDIDPQTTDGTNVTVDDVFLPEGGYVTIHDSSLLEGEVTGSVIGVSEYLDAGYYEDVEVTLFEGVPGADFADRELADNETLVAMPHLETTNDTTYDFVASDGAADGPYVTDGEPVVDDANVSLTSVGDGQDGEPGEGDGEPGEGDGETDGEPTRTTTEDDTTETTSDDDETA